MPDIQSIKQELNKFQKTPQLVQIDNMIASSQRFNLVSDLSYEISKIDTYDELIVFISNNFEVPFSIHPQNKLYVLLSSNFENLNIQNKLKRVLNLALIIGYDSLFYFITFFEKKEVLSSELYNVSPVKALEKFLECMSNYMIEKTLRVVLFRRFIKDNYPSAPALIDYMWPLALPQISEFGCIEDCIDGDFSSIDHSIIASAMQFLEHTDLNGHSHGRFGAPSLKMTKLDNEKELLEYLLAMYYIKIRDGDISSKPDLIHYFKRGLQEVYAQNS